MVATVVQCKIASRATAQMSKLNVIILQLASVCFNIEKHCTYHFPTQTCVYILVYIPTN